MGEFKPTITLYGSLIALSKGIAAIGTILAGLWLFGEPYLGDYVEERIKMYDVAVVEANSSKGSLRNLFSEEMNVTVDRVHMVQGDMYRQYIDIKHYMSRIRKYFNQNIPYMYLRNGKEYFVYDSTEYEVARGETGSAFYFRDGKWRSIP